MDFLQKYIHFLTFLLCLTLIPSLSMELSVDSNEYSKLDDVTIEISNYGNIKEGFLFINHGSVTIYEDNVVASSDGSFSYSFTIPVYFPHGKKTALFQYYKDGQQFEISKEFTVKQRREDGFFVVTFFSPAENSVYRRTDNVEITVNVKSGESFVEDATVKMLGPSGRFLDLSSLGGGKYSLSHELRPEEFLGNWFLYVIAYKENDGVIESGSSSINLNIETIPINVEFKQPVQMSYSIGDTIPVSFEFSYLTQKEIVSPRINFTVNNVAVEVNCTGNLCSTELQPKMVGDAGNYVLSAHVEDLYKNKGNKDLTILIGGGQRLLLITFLKYFVVAFILITIFFVVTRRKVKATREKDDIIDRFDENLAAQKKLQKDYYEEGAISRDRYDKQMNELTAEMMELQQIILEKNVDPSIINQIKEKHRE